TALKWSEPKLKGTEMHNFAAFFKQGWRENDYIWGRLDAAEFFTKLIGPPNTTEALTAALTAAFNAVLNEEDDLPILTSPGPDSFRSKLKVLIDGIGTNPQKS
ncbi:MAG: patatin, partial [Micrococcaceae bacterium]|nr:patatin [Micrococcaceae bacterium]